MPKIKIVMIDDSYRRYRNGLVNALLSSGIEVTVIAPYNTEDTNIIKNVKWLKPLRGNATYLNIKPLRIIHHSVIVSNNILARNRFIRKLKPSIIHMQGISFPLFELFLGKRFNIPRVLTVHNVIPHDKSMYNLAKIQKKAYQKCRFDAFIVHSEMCKKILCSYYPFISDRIFVIPHGCREIKTITKYEARLKLHLPVELYPLILFFGSIRKYKGLSYLIQSLSNIEKHFSDVKLVIAGRVLYDKLEKYMRVINEENLTNRIILRIGHVPEEKVDLYFQAADLLVLPYTSFTSQSGVLMKAYSNQCPVVVTNTGAMGEAVSNDAIGMVVHPSSVKDLTNGIMKMLSSKQMQKNARKNMLLLAQTKYNWDTIAKETINLYNKLFCISV